MFAIERQQRILEKLKEDGAVSVSKLSSEFQVAEETIRRDLEKLEKQEKLLRTHGGAVPVDDNKYEPSLEKRRKRFALAWYRLAPAYASENWSLPT